MGKRDPRLRLRWALGVTTSLCRAGTAVRCHKKWETLENSGKTQDGKKADLRVGALGNTVSPWVLTWEGAWGWGRMSERGDSDSQRCNYLPETSPHKLTYKKQQEKNTRELTVSIPEPAKARSKASKATPAPGRGGCRMVAGSLARSLGCAPSYPWVNSRAQ